MPTKFAVPDACTGIDMQDGTSYKAHAGTIEVERPSHIRAIKRNAAAKDGWMINAPVTFIKAEGKECECGFAAFAWQDECPRCGRRI